MFPNHWSCTQTRYWRGSNITDGILGIAAQFALDPYIIEKVKHDDKPLKYELYEPCLLEHAVFGWHQYNYPTHEDLTEYYGMAMKLQQGMTDQRIEIVKAFLDAGVKSNDVNVVLTRINQMNEDTKLEIGPQEYWD